MNRRDFGRYKIAEELGRGAMGVVYRATDPLLARSVAIKAINEAYIAHLGIPAAEYYERFQREAEVAGGLNHPRIVKIFDVGPDYIVMELVEGQSLEAALRARTHFALSRILEMVAQVADALDHAHAQGIVHRDIKPANIMLRTDGTVSIMDFGLARIESSTLTAAGELLGSASYMAPEVVLGARADAKSDIFALGVVAYELMTGERPFAGPSITSILYKIVQSAPPSAHDVDLNVPPDYDAIFARVLAKAPAARYQNAGDFARDLVLKKWADRDPVLAAGGQIEFEPTLVGLQGSPESPEEVTEEASPLEALVPQVLPPAEAAPPVAEAPTAESTVITAEPEVGAAAPAPPEAPSVAFSEAETPTPPVQPDQGEPHRNPARVQLSGQASWGPDSRRPRAAERADIPKAPSEPPAEATVMMMATPNRPATAEAPREPQVDAGAATVITPPPTSPLEPPAEATVMMMATPTANRPATAEAPAEPPVDPGAATVITPPPTAPLEPPAAYPDETGPLGVTLPPIPVLALPSTSPTAPGIPAPRKGISPALLLGGLAAVVLFGSVTVAGLAYFFLHRGTPGAESPPPPSRSMAAPESQDMPLPEAEVPKATPAAAPPQASAEPSATPTEASDAAGSPVSPSPAAEPAAPAAAQRAAREPATLVVSSRPAGAKVTAGSVSGLTPSRLTLQPGPVTVAVEKEGFQPWRKRLTLASGRTEQVNVRLVPLPTPALASRPPQVKTGDLVALAADVTPPRRLGGEGPSYPDQAQKKKLSGSVLLEFVVTETGEVQQPEILESAGELLDKVSIEAVSRWRYQPAEKAGVKVKVKQQARFTFKAH